MKAFTPAYSTRAAPIASVTLADAKGAIGIVSDNSMDRQVMQLLQAATDYVTNWAQGNVLPSKVADYYAEEVLWHSGVRLELSAEPANAMAALVEVTTMAGPTLVTPTVYDPTARNMAFVFYNFDWPDNDGLLANPVKVTYTAQSNVSQARINQAVLQVIPIMFQGGSTAAVLPNLMRNLGFGGLA